MSASRVRSSSVAGSLLAGSLLLGGCGETPPPPSASANNVPISTATAPTQWSSDIVIARHVRADITFAQEMIPLHQRAVEMADLAAERAVRADVKSLAEQIAAARRPEVIQMIDSLNVWGAETPPPGSSDGGVSNVKMRELRHSTGPAFDATFLSMMIEHHRGAVSEARKEVEAGSNPQAKRLAAKIIADLGSEIARMTQLLG